jgi:hypothetical protein
MALGWCEIKERAVRFANKWKDTAGEGSRCETLQLKSAADENDFVLNEFLWP